MVLTVGEPLGQPYENPDADRWFDWPRFPPF
jgi:hypothetical protein